MIDHELDPKKLRDSTVLALRDMADELEGNDAVIIFSLKTGIEGRGVCSAKCFEIKYGLSE